MNPPSLAVRRGAAIGLLVLAAGSIWNLALRPLYRATTEAVERLEDSRFELRRLTGLAHEAASTNSETQGAELERLQEELFTGPQDADADGRFVAVLNELLRSSKTRLVQLKAGAPTRSGSLTRLTADIQLTGSEADLVALLSTIEQHRPRLIVERATLVSSGNAEGEGLPPPELTAELRVSGFGMTLDRPASPP